MSTDESTYREQFGRRLQAARKRLGLNQAEFARNVGVAKNTLSRYERGELSPPADTLAAIASEVAEIVTADWLLHGDAGDLDMQRRPVDVESVGAVTGFEFGKKGGSATVSLSGADLERVVLTTIQKLLPDNPFTVEIAAAVKKVTDYILEAQHPGCVLHVPIARHGVRFLPVVHADQVDAGADVQVAAASKDET